MSPPPGWLTKSLADVAQLMMGQSPDSKYYLLKRRLGFRSSKAVR